MKREAQRFLGLELSGAKSEKTAIASLEYYPKEKKIFLLDIYDQLTGDEHHSADEALVELIEELREERCLLAVNVPLTLPPCLNCPHKNCRPGKCPALAVKWMRNFAKKLGKGTSKKAIRVRQLTPYTLRPVELWVRHAILPDLPEHLQFEVDEALGGTKAPLTARMNFLQRCLSPDLPLIEVWPKLSIAILGQEFKIPRRTMSRYRSLEEGPHARAEILDILAREHDIFIYDRDLRKLSLSLSAFDAFICALTALLSARDLSVEPPHGFPLSSGWVAFPVLTTG